MKLEFIGREHGGLDETSCIYITKGELLKAYKDDKKKAFHDLNGIIEMFTSPACFYEPMTLQAFEKICNVHLQKTTYKGILLTYGEDENGNSTLQVSLVKNS